MNRDSRGKTLAKTVVYRVWAIALLAAITYYYTGNAGEATTVTILFNLGATLAYYGLERLWESMNRGRTAMGLERSHVPIGLSAAKTIEDVETA